MARHTAVILGLATAVALAGCAGPAPSDEDTVPSLRSAGAPAVNERWESCAVAASVSDLGGGPEALSLPRLDDGFAAVAAVVCRAEVQRRVTGGSDLVAVEDRADDVGALVATLKLPDVRKRQRDDIACTQDLPIVPWIALLDAQGRWVRPGVPHDICHKPRTEFRTAFERLRTTRVASRVVREVESDRAANSGCAQDWADMVWVTGQSGGGRSGAGRGAVLDGDGEQARVCRYRVPAAEQGGGKPTGVFESGGVLPAAQWAAVRSELTAAAPAADCRTPGSRFAVLHLSRGLIYVEADSCRRVLIEAASGPSVLLQGTTALISVVFPP